MRELKPAPDATPAVLPNAAPTSHQAAIGTARIQARSIMAAQNPRNEAAVRQRLMNVCADREFAEGAWYSISFGNGDPIEGFSTRMAEEVLTQMGHMSAEVEVVSETNETRILTVTVTDYQTGAVQTETAIIRKIAEKRFLRKGQQAIYTRMNSAGKPTYGVAATEMDLRAKTQSEVSKAKRAAIMRLVPYTLRQELKRAIINTRSGAYADDPGTRLTRLRAGFQKLGVKPEQLCAYLRVDSLSGLSEEVFEQLSGLYTALRDGEITSDQAFGEPEAASPKRKVAGSPSEAVLKAAAANAAKRQPTKAEPEPDQKPVAAAVEDPEHDDREAGGESPW